MNQHKPGIHSDQSDIQTMPWYERGQLFVSQGRYEKALETVDMALKEYPQHPEIWVFHGVILIHLERYLDALESCDRALEIQPNSPQAWTLKGVALHRLHRYPEAYTSYERALGGRRVSHATPVTRGLKWVWKSLIMKLYFHSEGS